LLIGCSTIENPEKWMEREKNACLPTAIAFQKGLERQGLWSKVLIYRYLDRNMNKRSGHAVTVYLYPPGKNQLWTYDYLGSYRVRAYNDRPIQIAEQTVFVRNQWNLLIETAEFLD
jgi:hypothetical protein